MRPSSALVALAVAPFAASIPYLGGVNTAGYNFPTKVNGSARGMAVPSPVAQFSHFASQGVNAFRIPFTWQFMTPTLGGKLDADNFAKYNATVKAALATSTKPYVILDLVSTWILLYNYARRNGGIIGQGGPTNEQFASIWSQLAAYHHLNLETWAKSVQAAVNAIRAAGATNQTILLPGSHYSSLAWLPVEAGPSLLKVTDPAGGTSKLVFDVHRYPASPDEAPSASVSPQNVNPNEQVLRRRWSDCQSNRKAELTNVANWLSANKRKAFEVGGQSTPACGKYLKEMLAFLKSRQDVYAGFTVWSAGGFNTQYPIYRYTLR